MMMMMMMKQSSSCSAVLPRAAASRPRLFTIIFIGLLCLNIAAPLIQAARSRFAQALPGLVDPAYATAAAVPSAAEQSITSSATFTVFFATDRNLSDAKSVEPGDNGSLEQLEYGSAQVAINPGNEKAATPTLLHKLTSVDDVVIQSMDYMQHDFSSFTNNISTYKPTLQSSHNTSFDTTGSSDVLIFIHGFNTDFDQAIKRTAQLAYDLNFPGAAIAYSWNSAGSLAAYSDDEMAIELTVPYFASFLTLCITQVKGERLHVLAHSMGNRALMGALKILYVESNPSDWINTGLHVKNLIFAAADENMTRFQDTFPRMKEIHDGSNAHPNKKPHLSVYCATNDLALHASEILHQDSRIGITYTHLQGGVFTVMEDPKTGYIDVIDATDMGDDEGLNHNYYGDVAIVLYDLQLLMTAPGKDRAFSRAPDNSTIYNVSDGMSNFYSFSPQFWAAANSTTLHWQH